VSTGGVNGSAARAAVNVKGGAVGPVVNAARLGFRALGVGSLLSVGGVGLMTAGVFFASGCSNLQELLSTWRRWTPERRRDMERTFGIRPKSREHEDVLATAHMTEEEEWEFIKEKYIPELVEGGEGGRG